MTSGIYCIKNRINNKCYIGQSVDLNRRKHVHFYMLRKNRHPNAHLQAAFNRYAEDSFYFTVLIYCEKFEMTRYEQFFVTTTPAEFLYNKCLECVNSRKGISVSSETKKKLSVANKGKRRLECERKIMSESRKGSKNHFYGKHHSEESKKQIAEKHKNLSPEIRLKLSKAKLGKHLSDEHKRKISDGSSGENNGMYGKHHSEESKRKTVSNRSTTKLNDDKVKEIVNKLLDGFTIKALGDEYGVSFKTISKIKNNQRWIHISPDKRERLIEKRIK